MKKLLKLASLMVCITLLAIFAAACAQQPTYSNSNGGGVASTSGSNAASTSSSSSVILNAASVPINGANKTVLTDPQGKTLYYFTPDSPAKSACLSSCAGSWPPLLASNAPKLATNSPFSGRLTVVDGGNGKQVQYNGHFVYTFSGDTAPGDAHGQGIGGKWFVITPAVK